MIVYKYFKKDPASVAANLFRVVSCLTLGLLNPADMELVLGAATDRRADSHRERLQGQGQGQGQKGDGDCSKSDLAVALLDREIVSR